MDGPAAPTDGPAAPIAWPAAGGSPGISLATRVGVPLRRFSAPELSNSSGSAGSPSPDLIGLLHTYSYVIRASPLARAELDAEVAELARRYFPGGSEVTIPMVCQVWLSRCR